MVEIRLYGKLRLFAKKHPTDQDKVIRVSPNPGENLEMLLERMDIPVDEIYTIFINSKLLATRSGMAVWMGYQQVRKNPFDWDLKVLVTSGDRVGLFGRDMANLVV